MLAAFVYPRQVPGPCPCLQLCCDSGHCPCLPKTSPWTLFMPQLCCDSGHCPCLPKTSPRTLFMPQLCLVCVASSMFVPWESQGGWCDINYVTHWVQIGLLKYWYPKCLWHGKIPSPFFFIHKKNPSSSCNGLCTESTRLPDKHVSHWSTTALRTKPIRLTDKHAGHWCFTAPRTEAATQEQDPFHALTSVGHVSSNSCSDLRIVLELHLTVQ